MSSEIPYFILGLKNRFNFIIHYQPDCSSDLWRRPAGVGLGYSLYCQLEVKDKHTLFNECNNTERRGGKVKSELESLVSAQFSES